MVFARDEFTCQDCGEVGGKLTADHIRPWSLYPELRFECANGQTLCRPCHRKTDTFGYRVVANAMSIRRWAAKVDANQKEIVKALEAVGVQVWPIRLPCDLLCLSNGAYWVIEIKNPDGKNTETKGQRELREDAQSNGAPYFLIRSVDEALAARRTVLLRSGRPESYPC